MFPLILALEVLPGGQAHAWGRYVLSTMMVGFPYVHAIIGEFRNECIGREMMAAKLMESSGNDESECWLCEDAYRRFSAVQHVCAGF